MKTQPSERVVNGSSPTQSPSVSFHWSMLRGNTSMSDNSVEFIVVMSMPGHSAGRIASQEALAKLSP